jgi:hypothetical protein
MTDLFLTPEQGRDRLQEMRKQVAQSRKHPRAKGASKQATLQANPVPDIVLTVSMENIVSNVTTETTVQEDQILMVQPKTRRPRRTKLQMQEARAQEAREQEEALNPIQPLAQEISSVTFHNHHAEESATEEKSSDDAVSSQPQQEDEREADQEAVETDPDALIPESIAYLVSKVLRGRQLCMEDRTLLEQEARKHKLGLLPFVHTHARVTKEFLAVIAIAKESLSQGTEQGNYNGCFELDTAIALTLDHSYLCSEANIVLLDSVLLEAPMVHQKIVKWRNHMRRIHGFDFKNIDAVRPAKPHADTADVVSV